MIPSYEKLLDLETLAISKLEKDRQELERIQNVLYQKREYIVKKLITYLQKELQTEYSSYQIKDMNGNTANVLIKTDSQLFKNEIEGKESVNCSIEEFIDNRMIDNEDEIIILDLNFSEELLDLEYLCKSLEYPYISYSKEVVDKLSTFINYVIEKNMERK